MKKWIKYIVCASFITTLSCGDDFLEIKPLSIFTPESVYTDKAGFEGVLVNLRKNLRPDFYGQGGGLACELIASDLAISANKQQDAVHNFDTQVIPTGTGSTYDFHEIWTRAYNQVRNANVILSRINNGKFDSEEIKNAIIAEAYFHRAYWYYRLIHLFGDVPFLNVEHTAPKIDFYTHTRKSILTKITEDMAWAVQWLPEKITPGAVSKAAGNHLLTKIYLADGKFEEAIQTASAVIDGGIHNLMEDRFGVVASDPSYNVIWDLHQKENKSSSLNKEGILVVQDRYGFPDAEAKDGTQSMRRYVPAWWNASYIKDPDGKKGTIDTQGNEFLIKVGRGVGYVRACSYHNYEIWNNCNKDLRHDNQVNWFSVDKFIYNNPASKYYGQPVQIQYTNPLDTIHCWYPFPYYKIYVEDEERPDQPYGGHSDWYLFRLAETYLLRAEAYYWSNQMDKAANDINAVRTRASADPISAADVSIDYILDERARELFAEEFRKTELTRIAFIMAENSINGYTTENFTEKNFWYDRVMTKNEFYKAGNILWGPNIYKLSPFHVLWPIPADAIDSNQGGIINQNKGYVGYEKNGTPLTVIDDQQ
ncbi:RagB/SusD family nutrient uptake outer membrane protein [Parabacteroides acidifaciens]|uniref:RagB/SusD family nutrient uptake outer membrane protein n=1 Tax=Parabacteroides acidifaciens TaxID=2290935 RepID=A0A3D8H8T0_9BACT|nr:RagB/SusD family nutrient uptake outer membrane protein [Parabacteroides acidifaciens]MBC8603873.1 RagB/SusD family nutrient uptake outer membrane protein [Parabacteroides acidifaciens]RDU47383.1 RagB/SusD family nutrient uptake outer membrane protein [Parabacteroides acidifaciens]